MRGTVLETEGGSVTHPIAPEEIIARWRADSEFVTRGIVHVSAADAIALCDAYEAMKKDLAEAKREIDRLLYAVVQV